MFELAAGLVSGGWNALSNITSGIGTGISRIGSTFFPAAQRTTVQSEITQAAGGQGLTYRPTLPSATSIWETNKMEINNWLDTPYEAQYAIPTKIAESNAIDKAVSATQQGGISGMFADIMAGLKGATQYATEVKTIISDLAGSFGLRSPISEGPAEIGNSRGQVQYENTPTSAGANVIETLRGLGGAIADQVKGLYNLAFPQDSAQPSFSIAHEIQPSAGLSTGLIIAGVVLVIVLILTRKK